MADHAVTSTISGIGGLAGGGGVGRGVTSTIRGVGQMYPKAPPMAARHDLRATLDCATETTATLSASTPVAATLSGTGGASAWAKLALAKRISEDPAFRARSAYSAAFGTGWQYRRVFNMALNIVSDVRERELAYGAPMQACWMSDEDTALATGGIESPLLQSLSEGKQRGTLEAVFISVDITGSCPAGYVETMRTSPRRKDQFTDIIETWGIAPSEEAAGIPNAGDTLSNTTGTLRPICLAPVDIDRTAHKGRVLVHATWLLNRAATLIEG